MTIIRKNSEVCDDIIKELKKVGSITISAEEVFEQGDQLEFFELEADTAVNILFEENRIVYCRSDNDWNDLIDFVTDDYRDIDEDTLVYWHSFI